jgi:hypothetical protein
MGVFGQVWLWSLVAFLIGAALSWFWVARPLRRQVEELEWELEEARSAASPGGAPDRAAPPGAPGPRGDQPARWDAADSPTSIIPGFDDAPPGRTQPVPPRQPGPERAERRMPSGPPGPVPSGPPGPVPSPAGPPPLPGGAPSRAEVSPTQVPPGGIPPAPRTGAGPPAEPRRTPPPAPGPGPRPGQPAPDRTQPQGVFGGVLPPQDVGPTETTTQLGRPGAEEAPEWPVEEIPDEPARAAEPDPRTHRPTAPPEPNVAESARPPRTTEAQTPPPSRISGAFDPGDQVLAPPEVTGGHGWPELSQEYDEIEDAVDTAEEERPSDARAPGAERERSLFEPLVDPEQQRRHGVGRAGATNRPSAGQPPPPPSTPAEAPAARMPFGPGSALPRPDGSAPSPDFHVKALLPSRHYVTPDEPEFEHTRAQVWFRSPADAQRAGFVTTR